MGGWLVDWLTAALGALLVLMALRDVFHTLWHPRGVGRVCRAVFALSWWLGRRTPGRGELAGPLGLLATAVTWALLVVAGFSLVYLPWMPSGFHFSSSLQPDASSDAVASIYLSLVAVATLGLGDIMPAAAPLRVLVPVQALVGFVLLTAVITWLLQIYPALVQRRSLARRLTLLARTGAARVVTDGDTSVATSLLDSVASGLSAAEMNLVLYGETYYFRESDPTVALAAALPAAVDLADAGARASAFEVRHAAAVLQESLASFATVLERYVDTDGSEGAALVAFATDHGHRPVIGRTP